MSTAYNAKLEALKTAVPDPPTPGDANEMQLVAASDFARDPSITFLNHGSYGSNPRWVSQQHHDLEDLIEFEPDEFVRRTYPQWYDDVVQELATWLNAPSPDSLGLFQSSMAALNAVLFSFEFQPGDQIVVSNLLYGKLEGTLAWLVPETGVDLVVVHVDVPLPSTDVLLTDIASAITENTRLVIWDLITSSTALRFPVEDICALCNDRNVPILVDAAHGIGQVAIDLCAWKPTFLNTNVHKWGFAKRGCTVLFVDDAWADRVKPLTLWTRPKDDNLPLSMYDRFKKQGVVPFSHYLSASFGYRWHTAAGGQALIDHCLSLCQWATAYLCDLWGTSCLQNPPQCFMSCIRCPIPNDGSFAATQAIWDDLLHQHGIEVAVLAHEDIIYIRISVNVYNSKDEYRRLGDAVLQLASANSSYTADDGSSSTSDKHDKVRTES